MFLCEKVSVLIIKSFFSMCMLVRKYVLNYWKIKIKTYKI